jgi:hypothetical protein
MLPQGNTGAMTIEFWRRSFISSFQCFYSVWLHSPIIVASFIFHTFFCLLSFISLSKFSLWTPNYLANQELFKFWWWRKLECPEQRKSTVQHNPHRKSLLYCATYLVPQARIEPAPRTDMGYRQRQYIYNSKLFVTGLYQSNASDALIRSATTLPG